MRLTKRPIKHRARKRVKDISCPDCGLDPHTDTCRFKSMGPPPTEFKFLTEEDIT